MTSLGTSTLGLFHSGNWVTGILIVLSALQSVQASWTWRYLGLLSNKGTLKQLLNSNDCRNTLQVLEPHQSQFDEYSDVKKILAIGKGAAMAISECQRQFSDRRWTSNFNDTSGVFGPILDARTRETAFLYALSSAAITYSVSKACAQGKLEYCGCSYTSPLNASQTWPWLPKRIIECSGDIGYAYRFSRNFLDHVEQGKGASGLMNLWNNHVGRKIVKDTSRIKCKCHGKGCPYKSCYKKKRSFKYIGNVLKRKYDEARRVDVTKDGKRLKRYGRTDWRLTKKDLVYLEESPSFCEFSREYSSQGTRGRQCDKNLTGYGGCDFMCCGRGYREVLFKLQIRCNCLFKWCCIVECDTCYKQVIKTYCN